MAGRGRPKGSKKEKDPYAGLSEEFRAAIEGADEEAIRTRLSGIALEQQAIYDQMEADEDYKRAKEQAKIAGEGYTERKKSNKLMVKFCHRVLKSRGRTDD